MTFQLQTLLDLRRNAEKGACLALEVALAVRQAEVQEQARLLGCWQEACTTMAKEKERLVSGPNPTSAAQATARELYLTRLRDEVAWLARVAEEHRATALAAALAAESAAQATYEEAHKACEAVEKLKERAQAEDERKAERRADESAADLAQAMFAKRRSE
jgi:flagellar biosynthesis chaperone FliJ